MQAFRVAAGAACSSDESKTALAEPPYLYRPVMQVVRRG